jgi:CHAT domain-containing protein
VSARGGGALLLTVGGIRYLPLPGLTLDAVTAQVNAFHRALGEAQGDDEAAAESAEEQLSRVLEWLWDTAEAPVLDALDRRCRPAASYTPTVRALRYARQQARHRADPGRILVVAMPVTPGQRRLPGAGAEAAAVCGVLPASVVLAEPEHDERQAAPDNVPTKENVFRYLPACTIAHFACHADSDAADPSRSLLLLHDYQTAPLTVEALAQVDHERLELTYLSACSTAFTAATELADEAIHLTSAFLLAGSRHVVGTLWPTQDMVALSVATGFYNGLRPDGGELSTDRAAVALHDAVRETRQTWRQHPSLWATFLHAGA